MKHILKHYIFLLITLTSLLACTHKSADYRIGVAQSTNDAWRQQMNREMVREADLEQDSVSLDIRSCNMNADLQIKQIDSLVSSGIDLLVVSMCDSARLTPVINRVMKQGIPVIQLCHNMTASDYTARIRVNNFDIGAGIGSYVASYLGGHGSVVVLTGSMVGTAAQQRLQGIHSVFNKASGIHVLAQVETGWEGLRLEQQLDSLLQLDIVPQIFIAPNDRTGVRLTRLLRKKGHAEVKVVGVDGLDMPGGGLDNVEQGELLASFVYPSGGDKVIETAMRIIRGEPYKRDVTLRSALIDARTTRIFSMQRERIAENMQRIERMDSLINQSLSRNSMQKMLLFACVFIIVLIGIVLIMGLRMYYGIMKRNHVLNVQKQRLEEQHTQLVKMQQELEESTRVKLSFFTEVSHDLRTPLTLISSPVEQLLESPSLTPDQHALLRMVQTNTHTLTRLVGQMLDFRKYDEGKLRLRLSRFRIDEAFAQWCESFRALASKNLIRYHIDFQTPSNDMWLLCVMDANKMESVVFNILSNAFKHTPEGGQIETRASINLDAQDRPMLTMTFTDTGEGIEADKLPHIFERFYQADVHHEGSGIGLSMVKVFTELHGGTVSVTSQLGKGSCFTVVVPCVQPDLPQSLLLSHDAEQPEAKQKPTATSALPVTEATPTTADKASTAEADTDSDALPLVLVIDDNEDIRHYITILLQGQCRIVVAADGREGLDKARQLVPDVVVSDVMMPEVDGWEVCRQLKSDVLTSHIPVMLLTACSLDKQRIEGFESGADSYVSKPFSPDIFRARLRNLIDNRRRLKDYFSAQSFAVPTQLDEVDKSFAERLHQCIIDNMRNADFSVEKMAEHLGMNRTQLYRKVKALAGVTPVELIRVARVKKAAELLLRTNKSVAEITYEVGFANPSYLTRCFKDYYNLKPVEYREQNHGRK